MDDGDRHTILFLDIFGVPRRTTSNRIEYQSPARELYNGVVARSVGGYALRSAAL